MQGVRSVDVGVDRSYIQTLRVYCLSHFSPVVAEVFRSPGSREASLLLDHIKQTEHGAMLGRMAQNAAGDPQRLRSVCLSNR